MAFDTGLNDAMETMMARDLGRTTRGGGRMNAMVATSGTFDGGSAGTMNGLRMGLMDERQAEYEHSHRSALDINMEMMSAMRGDTAADYGSPGYNTSQPMSSTTHGGPSYGAPAYGTLSSGGPSMPTPNIGGGPAMMSPDIGGGPAMPTPNIGGGPAMMSPDLQGPPVSRAIPAAVESAPATPATPSVVVVPGARQTGPNVEKKAVSEVPETLVGAQEAPRERGSKSDKGEDEDEDAVLPSSQGVAVPNSIIRPTQLPRSWDDERDGQEAMSKKELLELQLRKLDTDALTAAVEDIHNSLASASGLHEQLLLSSKMELLGNEVERRAEAGIL